MPKGTKPPPPQQSSLKEMWGKKRGVSTSSAPKKEDAMDVDVKPESHGGSVIISQLRLLISSRAAGPSKPTAPAKASSPKATVKKRRIIESSDEEDEPRKKAKSQAGSSRRTSPLSVPPSSPGPIARSTQTDDEEVSAVESEPELDDEGEDEVIVSDDEELNPVATTTESKSAKAALGKKDEVDIPGGWKVGQPCVPCLVMNFRKANLSSECLTLPSPKLSL
jgi:DNA ligase 1